MDTIRPPRSTEYRATLRNLRQRMGLGPPDPVHARNVDDVLAWLLGRQIVDVNVVPIAIGAIEVRVRAMTGEELHAVLNEAHAEEATGLCVTAINNLGAICPAASAQSHPIAHRHTHNTRVVPAEPKPSCRRTDDSAPSVRRFLSRRSFFVWLVALAVPPVHKFHGFNGSVVSLRPVELLRPEAVMSTALFSTTVNEALARNAGRWDD